jgi:hypothetical protein
MNPGGCGSGAPPGLCMFSEWAFFFHAATDAYVANILST